MEETEQLHLVLKEIQLIKSSGNYKVFKSLNHPRIVFHVYLSNYKELKKELNCYYSENLQLENNFIRRNGQQNLIRCYHNLLASARAFTEQFINDSFKDDFHCFVKEFEKLLNP